MDRMAKPLLFADDPLFWFETLRSMSAADTAAPVRRGPGHLRAHQVRRLRQLVRRLERHRRPAGQGGGSSACRAVIGSAPGTASCGRPTITGPPSSSCTATPATPASPTPIDARSTATRRRRPVRSAHRAGRDPLRSTTLPGYLHRVDPVRGAAPDRDHAHRLRRLRGGDARLGARAAVERGYNVLAFDGPGQSGPLHREGLVFRPDWENVVTPVVDFALTLPASTPSGSR